DDVHTGADAAEYGIAPATRGLPLVIEESIVDDVDEELRGRAVGILGARQGYGTALVGQPVVRFVADRIAGRFAAHVAGKAAALDHETGNDAMEDRVVVVAGADISKEIRRRQGGTVGKEFDGDLAVAGLQDDLRGGVVGDDDAAQGTGEQ